MYVQTTASGFQSRSNRSRKRSTGASPLTGFSARLRLSLTSYISFQRRGRREIIQR